MTPSIRGNAKPTDPSLLERVGQKLRRNNRDCSSNPHTVPSEPTCLS